MYRTGTRPAPTTGEKVNFGKNCAELVAKCYKNCNFAEDCNNAYYQLRHSASNLMKMKAKSILATLVWIVFANTAWGFGTSYYVTVTYEGGEGYIYVSETEMDIEDVPFNDNEHDGLWPKAEGQPIPENGTPFWLYAKPAEGYEFLGWKVFKTLGIPEDEIFSTSPKVKREYVENNEPANRYEAVFSKIQPWKLTGVPDYATVYVNDNKVSPDADGVYTIEQYMKVSIYWGNNNRCKLDPSVSLLYDAVDGISFNMPRSDLNVIVIDKISLGEEGNSTVMESHLGKPCDVTFKGRTFHTDGFWNTLCLPFDVKDLTGTPLEGFTVKRLDTESEHHGRKTGFDSGTLYLNFKDVTGDSLTPVIEAGQPYIVKKLQLKEDAIAPTFAATEGTLGWTNMVASGYDRLFDGDAGAGKNWWPDFTSGFAYCEFNVTSPVVATGYTLTTGNQKVTQDPTAWMLKAKVNESDEWTIIDSRNAQNVGDALPSARSATKDYTIQRPGTYQYFRFEVTQNGGAENMCLSELAMQAFFPSDVCTIENPQFMDVVITSTEPKAVTSKDGMVSFKGLYSHLVIAKSGDKTKLYLGDHNELLYPEISFYINAFRAYLQLGKNLIVSSLGDVNGDRGINVTDVTFLVNYILGNTNSNFIVNNADVSGDGTVTVTDVTSLVNVILDGSNHDIYNVVVNGANGITFSDGGSGPARGRRK